MARIDLIKFHTGEYRLQTINDEGKLIALDSNPANPSLKS